jgi:hypothetical protein
MCGIPAAGGSMSTAAGAILASDVIDSAAARP